MTLPTTTNLELAIRAANLLPPDAYGFMFARGRVKPDEPLWGFSVWSLTNGLDLGGTPEQPLAICEHDDPLFCVNKALIKIGFLSEGATA